MSNLCARQVLPQGVPQARRQHGDAVFAALATAQPDLAAFEVQILHPKGQAFEEPEPAAIEGHPD